MSKIIDNLDFEDGEELFRKIANGDIKDVEISDLIGLYGASEVILRLEDRMKHTSEQIGISENVKDNYRAEIRALELKYKGNKGQYEDDNNYVYLKRNATSMKKNIEGLQKELGYTKEVLEKILDTSE